ncbi:MAG: efflux RND transporter periplasmic adaptor subunit [Deltaproteobacteria bacterium]|jgi:HlyD family secretion protein|nr:efflux RND transporter periplasmic adaptor subunit [Deltaproteobacteria bacterium]
MRKKLGTIIVIVILAVIALLIFRPFSGRDQASSYRTQRATMGQLRIAVSATGTLNPVSVVSVGTQISGTIQEILVDYNDEVKAGDLLLVLDDQLFLAKVRMARANLASSEAQMRLAQVKYERQNKLFAAKSSPQEELDTASANLEIAKAQVAQQEATLAQEEYNLNNTKIVSPVDGVVLDKAVDVGQTVAASFQTPTLINIAQDLSKMQINASFAEADIGRLVPGLEVSFTVDAYPGMNFQGRVRQIRLNPTVTSNVVTYDVVVDVDNPDLSLLPGMTAYVDIELYREDNALLIPNTALNFRPEGVPADPAALAPPEGGGPPAGGGAPGGGEDGPGEGELPSEHADHADGAQEAASKAGAAYSIPSKDDPPTKGKVYVLEKDDKARQVELLLGATDQRYTVVKGGDLKAGDQVIINDARTQDSQGTLFSTARPGGGPGRRF